MILDANIFIIIPYCSSTNIPTITQQQIAFMNRTFFNFFNGSDFAVWDVVQRAYDTGCTGLADMFESDLVIRTVPTESFFHKQSESDS
jgi:hypothetical protein